MKTNTKSDGYKASTVTLTKRKEWKEYGLLAEDITINGQKLNNYVLTQHNTGNGGNGEVVNFFSNLYHVLPNQDVIKVADRVAKHEGAKPYTPSTRASGTTSSWFKTNQFGSEHNNVMTNPNGTRMVANYVFPEKVDVTGAKDFVQFGFSCRNGIDKMTAFSCSPLSIRMTCDNIMFHLAASGVRSGAYGGLKKLNETETLKAQQVRIQDARQNLRHSGVRKLHFSTLNLDFVEDAIKNIRRGTKYVLKRYQEMVELKLAQNQAFELYERLPQNVLKDLKYLQGIFDKVEGKTILVKVNILDRKDPKGENKPDHPKLWDVFNDVTNSLTFATKRTFNSNLNSYKELDRILVHV